MKGSHASRRPADRAAAAPPLIPADEASLLLSVVVCTHDGAATLEGCLASLLQQSLEAALYEIVVVENACRDDSGGIVERLAARVPGRLRLVHEPTPGKSRAANRGAAASRGRSIAFTDDDVLAPPDWCARIVAAFEREAATVVAGSIRSRFETPPPPWLARRLSAEQDERKARGAGFLHRGRELYVVYGANLACEREAFLESGGFSPDWGPVAGDLRCGGEDTELALRLADRGARVWFDPDIVVEHREGAAGMAFAYRLRRKFLEGVLVSRLEGSVVCSARTLRGLKDAMRRLGGGAVRPASTRAQALPLPVTDRMADLLLRAAVAAGRLRGARMLRRGARE